MKNKNVKEIIKYIKTEIENSCNNYLFDDKTKNENELKYFSKLFHFIR